MTKRYFATLRRAQTLSPDLWWRTGPALLAIILPLTLSAFYAVWVDRLTGNPNWAQLSSVKLNKDSIDLFARDIGGRIQFGIASTLLRITACAGVIFAVAVLWRRATSRQVVAIVGTTIIACLVIYGIALWVDWVGLSKIDSVLRNISKALPEDCLSYSDIHAKIMHNLLAAFIGTGALLVCFAAVALRADIRHTSEADLRSRMRDLERTTIFAAVFLVLVTAVNKSLVDWPQAFLIEADQKAYAYLAGAIGSFWGVFCSLTLVFALSPAFIGLKLDIDAVAEGQAASWKKDNGLEFDMKSGIGAAIAAVAPILTVPGIDLLSKVLH